MRLPTGRVDSKMRFITLQGAGGNAVVPASALPHDQRGTADDQTERFRPPVVPAAAARDDGTHDQKPAVFLESDSRRKPAVLLGSNSHTNNGPKHDASSERKSAENHHPPREPGKTEDLLEQTTAKWSAEFGKFLAYSTSLIQKNIYNYEEEPESQKSDILCRSSVIVSDADKKFTFWKWLREYLKAYMVLAKDAILGTMKEDNKTGQYAVNVDVDRHGKIAVVGDVHGQFADLLRLLSVNGAPTRNRTTGT